MRVTDSVFWCRDSSSSLVTQGPRRRKRAGVDPSRHIFPRIFSINSEPRWLKNQTAISDRSDSEVTNEWLLVGFSSPSSLLFSCQLEMPQVYPSSMFAVSPPLDVTDTDTTSRKRGRPRLLGRPRRPTSPQNRAKSEPQDPLQARGAPGVARCQTARCAIARFGHEPPRCIHHATSPRFCGFVGQQPFSR